MMIGQFKMTGTPILQNMINALPYPAGYKDKNSVFAYANSQYANIVGLKDAAEIVGRTAYDMPAKISECAFLFHEQDKKVIDTGKHMVLFGIHPDQEGKFKAYKFIKIPLRDGDKKTVGTFLSGEEITNQTTYALSSFIKKMPLEVNGKLFLENGCYLVGTEHASIDMDERNHEILFYMLHGKQHTFIADVLGILPKDVDGHINQLKQKFDASSLSELKDKALDAGFLQILPASIFVHSISNALNQN